MRLITDGKNPASFNMALDEVISEAVAKELSPPTLRLYLWDRPSVTIGYFQRISDINTDLCSEKNYPIVRRITGGRAILHDLELTYSVSSLSGSFPFRGSLYENYAIISKALVEGLNMMGIPARMSMVRKREAGHRSPACFRSVSYGEVTLNGKKIIGSAQKRFSGSFLQQGSVMLGFDPERLCSVLAGTTMDDLREIGSTAGCGKKISPNDLLGPIKAAFEKNLRVKLIGDLPRRAELDLAKELAAAKYDSHDWNFSR